MIDVFISSENTITSLGFTTDESAALMLNGVTGIRLQDKQRITTDVFYASLVNTSLLREKFSFIGEEESFTRFEQLAICSIYDAISKSDLHLTGPDTLFILSTTKGNIELLEKGNNTKFGKERIYLWNTAKTISNHFGFRNEPLVVSTACISGAQAIITGLRLIRCGLYRNVVINGTDMITEFIVSGFNSLKSLSTGPCRPFDKTRDGLSLGEGSGTIILTSESTAVAWSEKIVVEDGFSSNDANHISGPSKSGEGLFISISRLLNKTPAKVDYISAHGTGTLYNDEMESIALTRAELNSIPVNSFKGYWGHTLGAAGVIETIMCLYSMRHGVLFGTMGYHEHGVTNPLKISNLSESTEINSCLKIASGFGGSNSALLLRKK